MSDGPGGDFVKTREFLENQLKVEADIATLRLEQAETRARLMHVPDKLEQISLQLNQIAAARAPAPTPPSELTAVGLGLQHVAEAIKMQMERQGEKPKLAPISPAHWFMAALILVLIGVVIGGRFGAADLLGSMPG